MLVTHETIVKCFKERGFHLRKVSRKKSHHFKNTHLIIIIIIIKVVTVMKV